MAVVTEGQNRQLGQGRPWPASVGHLAVKCGLTQVRAFGAWQHGHKHFSSSMVTPGQGCIHDQRRGSARPQRGNGLHPRDTHFDRRRTWTKSARRPRSCGAKATMCHHLQIKSQPARHRHWPRTGQNHRTRRPASVCVRWRCYPQQRAGGGAVHPIPSLRSLAPGFLNLRQSLRCQRISRNRPGPGLGQDLDHASQGGGCRRCTCSGDWPRRGAE